MCFIVVSVCTIIVNVRHIVSLAPQKMNGDSELLDCGTVMVLRNFLIISWAA